MAGSVTTPSHPAMAVIAVLSDTTEILLVVAGAVLGLLLALLVQPLLQDKAEVLLVRALGRFWVRRRGSLAGAWLFVWTKDDTPLTRAEEVALDLASVGKRVSGRFSWRGRQYWLLGRRETDTFISGTYLDEQVGNTFHGAFQLRIYPNEERMGGRWMGFDSKSVIVEGPWEWRRRAVATYPHEIDGAGGDVAPADAAGRPSRRHRDGPAAPPAELDLNHEERGTRQ